MPIINNTPGQPIYTGAAQPPFEQPRTYAAAEPAIKPHAILAALEQLSQQLGHMKQAQAITREAFRRLANFPEGDLLSLEKKILDELHQPKGAVTLDQVDDLIGKRLEQHGAQLIQVIDNLVVGILQGQRPETPTAHPHDPLGTAPDPTPNYPDDITEEEEEVGETPPPAAEDYPIPEEGAYAVQASEPASDDDEEEEAPTRFRRRPKRH